MGVHLTFYRARAFYMIFLHGMNLTFYRDQDPEKKAGTSPFYRLSTVLMLSQKGMTVFGVCPCHFVVGWPDERRTHRRDFVSRASHA